MSLVIKSNKRLGIKSNSRYKHGSRSTVFIKLNLDYDAASTCPKKNAFHWDKEANYE
jgi:hypothetical protein